jgi:hypothetical protein
MNAASTIPKNESPLSPAELPFAVRYTNVSFADEAAFCRRSECSRSICSQIRHKKFNNAVIFPEPAIQSHQNWKAPNYHSRILSEGIVCDKTLATKTIQVDCSNFRMCTNRVSDPPLIFR